MGIEMKRWIFNILALGITLFLYFGCLAQNDIIQDTTLSRDADYEKLHKLIVFEHKADSCIKELDNVGAASYLEKAKRVSDEINGYRKPEIYSELAKLYWHIGNDTRAMSLLHEALDFCENSNDTLNYGHILYDIGNIHLFWQEYENALSYYKQAMEIFRDTDQWRDLSAVHNNMGIYYKETGNYTAALAHFDTSYKLDSVVGNTVLNNIGNIYNIQGDYDKGLAYFQKAMKIQADKLTDAEVATYMNNIGRVYGLKRQFDSSFHFLNRAFNVATLSKNNKLRVQVLRNFADVNYMRGHYKEAFDYYKRYSDLNDSLFNNDKYRTINELTMLYDVEKKEQEITVLQAKEQLRILQINKQRRNFAFSLVAVFGLLFLVLFFRRKNITIRKAHDDLVRRNIDFQKQEERLLQRINDLSIKTKEETNKEFTPVANEDYEGKHMSETTHNDLLNGLIALMENDRIFEDKHLTIEKVSKMLNSNQKYLSQIINEEYQQNFNQYVNSFRIKKAVAMLSDTSNNYTIEAISEDAGFNSKSTFNSAFKKITGVTPSTFRNVVLRQNDQRD